MEAIRQAKLAELEAKEGKDEAEIAHYNALIALRDADASYREAKTALEALETPVAPAAPEAPVEPSTPEVPATPEAGGLPNNTPTDAEVAAGLPTDGTQVAETPAEGTTPDAGQTDQSTSTPTTEQPAS